MTTLSNPRVHLHAFSGKESGLMIIATRENLQALARELLARSETPIEAPVPNWPAPVLVLNAESPLQNCPEYQVSCHRQSGTLPDTLMKKQLGRPGLGLFLVIGFLAAVGALSILNLAVKAL